MQAAFSRWIQNRWTGGPAAFELKRVLNQSLPLSSLKEHQYLALRQVENNGIYHKIADGGFSQSPFDCFLMKGQAFLVIAYGPKLTGFYLLPISVIERLKKIGTVSVSESLAKEFGEYYAIPRK